MKEKLSIMFDAAATSVVEVLVCNSEQVVRCQWNAALWTWTAENEASKHVNPKWVGNIHEALRSIDFAAVNAPCEFRCNGNKFDGRVYVEGLERSGFFVAITPDPDVWSDEVQQWIESISRIARIVDPIVEGGIRFRIGLELSMANETGGSVEAAMCYSIAELITAYSKWRIKYLHAINE